MAKRDDYPKRCAASGRLLEKGEALKLVKSPDNLVVPDLDGTLPGEAKWIAFDKAQVATLSSSGEIQNWFGDNAMLMTDFEGRLPVMMRRQTLQWLALAKKAGVLIVGSGKARDALLAGKVKLVFQAKGGSERELSKLLQGPYKACSVCQLFESHELAGILGQNHIGYLALLKSELSEKIFRRCVLLETW